MTTATVSKIRPYTKQENEEIISHVLDALKNGESVSMGIQRYIDLTGSSRSLAAIHMHIRKGLEKRNLNPIFYDLEEQLKKPRKYGRKGNQTGKEQEETIAQTVAQRVDALPTHADFSLPANFRISFANLLQILMDKVEIINPELEEVIAELQHKNVQLQREILSKNKEIEALNGRIKILQESLEFEQEGNRKMVEAFNYARKKACDIL